MTKIKETYLKKYGVWEYAMMVIGIIVVWNPITYLFTMDFETASWDVIAMVFTVLFLGVLFIAAPLSILDAARKKFGLQTREEKLNQNKDGNA